MENFQLFVPKGTRRTKNSKVENPNPIATLDAPVVDGSKAKMGVQFNKAAVALLGLELTGTEYVAVGAWEDGVFFSVVDQATKEASIGLFARVGKNAKFNSKDAWELIHPVGQEVAIVEAEGMYQFVSTTEVTNPVTAPSMEAPVVEEEVVVDPFAEVGENVTEDFEF